MKKGDSSPDRSRQSEVHTTAFPGKLIPGWTWLPQRNDVPMAIAEIRGGPLAPEIQGTVLFQDLPGGTMISVYVTGLPAYQPATSEQAPIGPFGFHIHEFGNCIVGDPQNPFQAAGGHWNPTREPHGNHAGDLPVLFSNHGMAQFNFFTDRCQVKDLLDRTVIIHQNHDDYRSQPAGASGKRLACGVINLCSRVREGH